jgi:hypothetical protein
VTRSLFGARTAASLAALLVLAVGASARPGPQHRALRPLAMGNAFVALADDKDALYYNVAGLNLINALGNKAARPDQGAYPLTRMNARVNVVGASAPLGDGSRLLHFYQRHEESINDPDSLRRDETFFSELVPFSRKPIETGALHSAEFAMHNFGMAYWADVTVSPYIDDGILIPQAGIEEMRVDAVLQIAGARDFVAQRLSVGAGYSLANRRMVENFVLNLTDFENEEGEEGFLNTPAGEAVKDSLRAKLSNLTDVTSYGHGLDLGVLWQQTPWLRFGAAAQNLGMVLNGKMVRPELTVGAAVTPPQLSTGGRYARKVNFTADFEDLFNREKNSGVAGKINFGAEVQQNLSWLFGARLAGGAQGGYWSAGAGLSFLTALHLEVVTWAEEGGLYTGHIEERYYAFNVALGI